MFEGVDLARLANDAGTIGVLLIVVIGFLRGWIVAGHTYAELRRECDDWKDIAMTGTNAADRAVRVIELRRQGWRRDPGTP